MQTNLALQHMDDVNCTVPTYKKDFRQSMKECCIKLLMDKDQAYHVCKNANPAFNSLRKTTLV